MAKIRHDRPAADQPITEALEYQWPYGSEQPMTTPESIMDPAEPYRSNAALSSARSAEVGDPISEEALVAEYMKPADGRPGMNEKQARSLAKKQMARASVGDGAESQRTRMEASRVADEGLAEYRDATAPPAPERTAPLFSGPRDTGPSRTSSFTSSGTRFANPESEAEYRELHQMAAALREEAAGRRGHMATEVENRAITMSQQRAAMNLLAESGEEEARSRMAEIAKAYDEAEVDMASLRVDPRRWEQDTPALAQVLMGIGSAAFAFFTGGQGVNPIVALIDRAIERDTDAQMANMKAKLGAHQVGMEKQELLNKLEGNIRASMWQRGLNAYEGMVVEGQMQMQAQDQMDASTAMMDKATEARIASLQPYIQQYSATTQTAAAGGGGKQLTAKFISDYVTGAGVADEGLDLAEQIAILESKGQGITPITGNAFLTKVGTLLGATDGKAMELRRKVESYATRLARANKVEVGNFAVQEAKRFIEAVRGGSWDTVSSSFVNIVRSLRLHQQGKVQEAEALHSSGYDVHGLAPTVQGVYERLQRFDELDQMREETAKKKGK